MKKPSLKSLKKKTWKLFSEFIRRRFANKYGYAFCVTCGQIFHWKNLQASHFLSGRRNSILFVEENCHQACLACNVFRHGNLENYYPFMLARYGQEKIDELKRLKNEVFKPTRQYYEDKIEEYKRKLEGLEVKNGISKD